LLNFCFVGIRLSDQIKDDVQKAGVIEVPEINVLIEHMSRQNRNLTIINNEFMARKAKLEN
jgi:hypothetical protein